MEGARQKVVVIGAGPVGALAALYAAQRGDDVEVYELRGDPRDPSTVPLNWTKSINLALSERGINAMRHASNELLAAVMAESIPMGGRMIHGRAATGALTETAQAYDVHGRNINAVDRWQLNKTLLDALDAQHNVRLIFQHKLTGADYRTRRAWVEDHRDGATRIDGYKSRYPEIEIAFDLLIGADGAHSAARFHLMKFARMSYDQTYIDTLWCEFSIAPRRDGSGKSSSLPSLSSSSSSPPTFALSPNHLHIWPGTTHMFIAIPSTDCSFTCTLFAPETTFVALRNSPNPAAAVSAYFRQHFPGVTPELIPEEELARQFGNGSAQPLISIKCTPHHFGDSGVIVGDAAHAMVPFYGQGMNAGLEDVRVLFECLDGAGVYMPDTAGDYGNSSGGYDSEDSAGGSAPPAAAAAAAAALAVSRRRRDARTRALARYTALRTPDAAAISDLALGNYYEMRAGVVNPLYRLRKLLEESLAHYLPAAGFATQYVRVSFTNQRYSLLREDVARQGRLELCVAGALGGLALALATAAGARAYLRWSS